MRFVYELVADITEFVPGAGGVPALGSQTDVEGIGENRTIRIFSDDETVTIAGPGEDSGIRVFDPVLNDFIPITSIAGIEYADTAGTTIGQALAIEATQNTDDPVAGPRFAYALPVEDLPFLDFPPTDGVQAVEDVVMQVGVASIGELTLPEFAAGSAFPLADLVGDLLGETGEGLSEEAARDIALLYETGLDRDGDFDKEGVNFWIDVSEGGLTNEEIAQFFLDSEEFIAAFGDVSALTDEDYVELLYQNTLERGSDAAGLAFWTDQLGPDVGLSRSAVLNEFAVSVENAQTFDIVNSLVETAPGEWCFIG